MVAMRNVEIRPATAADEVDILRIYGPFVTDSSVTFVSTVPTPEEFHEKMARVARRFPYLVCTINGEVAGFAFAAEERPHDVFQWNTELSVFLDPRFHRKGVATALYTALIQILKVQGFYNLYAAISLPNDASIALHRHFGFEDRCRYERSGFKMGQWHDLVWMHLRLSQPLALPSRPPKRMDELATNDITTACAIATALLSGTR
jgi:L-amino acid N-acyltransferase YncA